MRIERINPKYLLTVYDNDLVTVRNVMKLIKADPDKNLLVGAERKLYNDEAKDIFRNLNNTFKIRDFSFKGTIPRKVIFFKFKENSLTVVWRLPKQKMRLFFTDEKYNDTYALPELLFKLKRNQLSVVALKKYGLKEGTYKAPFVNQNGGVCMGSASEHIDYNAHYVEDLIESAEKAFFNSKFSHIQDLKKMHLAGRGKDVYPVELLKSKYGTVKSFCN